MGSTTPVNNSFFAWITPFVVAHEPASVKALRRENLTGLSGRVLEVGAGTGANFPLYPGSIDQVVALEPEPHLAARARAAAAGAPVRVRVIEKTIETFSGDSFDAVV